MSSSAASSQEIRDDETPAPNSNKSESDGEAAATSRDDAESGPSRLPSMVHGIDDASRFAYGRTSLHLLATFAVIAGLYFARAILFPIALAFVLYFLFAPVVRFMSRVRWLPESISAAIVVLSVTISVGTLSIIFSGPVSEWFATAPQTFKRAEQKLRFLIEPVDKLDKATDEVSDIADGKNDDGTVKVAIDQPPVTSYVLNATANFLAGLTITIALVYLLLAMGHRTLNSIVSLLPTFRDKRGVVTMLRDVEQGISGYLISVTAINLVLGLIIGTVLGLLGFPDPVLLGMMAATLNFIPFVGCFIGSAVTFLIGIVYLDTPTLALAGSMSYLMINIVEGNVITPMILGRSMKLNPPIVFLSLVFWGWVWGIGGILIAVPLLGIAKIVCEHFDSLKPIAHVLSG